jgi:ABC-type lipoprotein export system ATPase subunit
MSLVGEYQKNGGTVVLVSHDPVALTYSNLDIKIENGICQS